MASSLLSAKLHPFIKSHSVSKDVEEKRTLRRNEIEERMKDKATSSHGGIYRVEKGCAKIEQRLCIVPVEREGVYHLFPPPNLKAHQKPRNPEFESLSTEINAEERQDLHIQTSPSYPDQNTKSPHQPGPLAHQ